MLKNKSMKMYCFPLFTGAAIGGLVGACFDACTSTSMDGVIMGAFGVVGSTSGGVSGVVIHELKIHGIY